MTDESGRADRAAEALEREIGVLLRRARSFSSQIASRVHPDLEPAAYGILVRLATSDDARLTDLASWFGVGKPTMSRQVSVLEGLGLVSREPDPADARAHVLRLTADGSARLAAARGARQERFRALLAQWPSEDVDMLSNLLHRFNALGD